MVRSHKYRVRLSSPSIWFPSRSRLRQKRPEGCAYPLGRRFLLCLHLPDVQHRQKSRGSVPPHRKIHELFPHGRSEEHTSELQSLMRISYAVFCLKKKKNTNETIKVYNIHTH